MVPELQLLHTPADLEGFYLGLAIVKYIIDAAVLVINGAVVLLLIIQKLFCKQRTPLPPSGYFVVNLLVSDTLVGVILVCSQQFKLWPETAVELAKWHYACSFRFAIGFFALCGSHNALLSMIIDRYIAIAHTLHYRESMTTSRSLRMIAASWLIPVIGWIYLMFFGDWRPDLPACNEYYMLGSFVYVWLCLQVAVLISVVVIQICVHLKIRHYEKNQYVSTAVLRQSSKKSARVMLISTIAFFLGYAPYEVAITVYVSHPNPTTKLLHDLSTIGSASTFLINPCLYSFKTESICKRLSTVFTDLRNALAPCGARKVQENNHGRAMHTVSVIGSNSVINSNHASSSTTFTSSLRGMS